MRFYFIFLFCELVNALIGYDCGGRHLNITTVSLLDPGDCNTEIKAANSTTTYIQLLQLSDYHHAEVIQCKAEIVRTVFHCGMHSHISAVHHGQMSYLEHLVREECEQMQTTGSWTVGLKQEGISGLKPNNTIVKSITLAGSIDNEGKCEGVSYNDAYGSWTNAVVQGYVRITLKSGYVPIHLKSGKVMLKSGATCDLQDGHCLDPDDGYSFWKAMPTTSCDFHQYDVLYEGMANKTRDETSSAAPLVYSLETQDITFALTTTTQHPICGYVLLKTEHPRLFILETSKANVPKRKEDIPVDNLDIFTYVNSKFVYVEKHIRTQMTSLYNNVIEHRCKLEKEIITNTLSLATLLPDEFAYRLMKGPGYMAVTAGEAIHVIKCIPVEIIVRKTEECYLELPITVRNTSLWLTPKSRILTKVGTQRECSQELPTLYRIEDTWVQFTPQPHVRHLEPQRITPLTTMTWKYLVPGPLSTSGIYSKQDIDKLRDHIMFPAEKPAVLNSLAMGISGYKTGGHFPSMYNLLDEESIHKIAESAAKRIWTGFIKFGSATAGVMGIFIIIRLIKLIIDTAIHGYALHTVYGCSLHLLGAIWSSLTHLLIHLANKPLNKSKIRRNTDSTKPGGNAVSEDLPTIKGSQHLEEVIIKQPNDYNPHAPSQVAETVTYATLHFKTTNDTQDYVEMRPLQPSATYKELSKRLDNLDKA